jgi:hypothetical protein
MEKKALTKTIYMPIVQAECIQDFAKRLERSFNFTLVKVLEIGLPLLEAQLAAKELLERETAIKAAVVEKLKNNFT